MDSDDSTSDTTGGPNNAQNQNVAPFTTTNDRPGSQRPSTTPGPPRASASNAPKQHLSFSQLLKNSSSAGSRYQGGSSGAAQSLQTRMLAARNLQAQRFIAQRHPAVAAVPRLFSLASTASKVAQPSGAPVQTAPVPQGQPAPVQLVSSITSQPRTVSRQASVAPHLQQDTGRSTLSSTQQLEESLKTQLRTAIQNDATTEAESSGKRKRKRTDAPSNTRKLRKMPPMTTIADVLAYQATQPKDPYVPPKPRGRKASAASQAQVAHQESVPDPPRDPSIPLDPALIAYVESERRNAAATVPILGIPQPREPFEQAPSIRSDLAASSRSNKSRSTRPLSESGSESDYLPREPSVAGLESDILPPNREASAYGSESNYDPLDIATGSTQRARQGQYNDKSNVTEVASKEYEDRRISAQSYELLRAAKAHPIRDTAYHTLIHVLNEQIEDAANHRIFARTRRDFEDEGRLNPSVVGATAWSSDEKNLFFDAIALFGKDDIVKIAEAVGGDKTPLQIAEYIQVMDEACEEYNGSFKQPALRSWEIPGAVKIPRDLRERLQEAALEIEDRLRRQEERAEQKRYGEYWLIDHALSKKVRAVYQAERNAIKKARLAYSDRREHLRGQDLPLPPQTMTVPEHVPSTDPVLKAIPCANLIHLPNFIRLSTHVFMNPKRRRKRMFQPGPSMRQTACNDLPTLAVSLTRRIMSVVIYQVQTRLRARRPINVTSRQFLDDEIMDKSDFAVGVSDVRNALDAMGLKWNSFESWVDAPRRYDLTCSTYGAKSNFEQHIEGEGEIDLETAEEALRQPVPRRWAWGTDAWGVRLPEDVEEEEGEEDNPVDLTAEADAMDMSEEGQVDQQPLTFDDPPLPPLPFTPNANDHNQDASTLFVQNDDNDDDDDGNLDADVPASELDDPDNDVSDSEMVTRLDNGSDRSSDSGGSESGGEQNDANDDSGGGGAVADVDGFMDGYDDDDNDEQAAAELSSTDAALHRLIAPALESPQQRALYAATFTTAQTTSSPATLLRQLAAMKRELNIETAEDAYTDELDAKRDIREQTRLWRVLAGEEYDGTHDVPKEGMGRKVLRTWQGMATIRREEGQGERDWRDYTRYVAPWEREYMMREEERG